MVSGTLLCPLPCCKEDRSSRSLSLQVAHSGLAILIPLNQMALPPELLWTVLARSHMACSRLVKAWWASAEVSLGENRQQRWTE